MVGDGRTRDNLELLVERELHRDVGYAQQTGQKPTIKRADAFGAVNRDGGV